MDIIMYKKAATFLTKFYSNRKELIPEKASITKKATPTHSPICYPFPRTTPESVGIESAHLLSFLKEYSEMTELHPHALMIMKDNQIILETEFFPYRADTWHVSHSLCKSITALAIGLLIDDGILHLDDKITEIFTKRTFNLDFVRQKEITIRHLLNMSACVTFNEMGSVLYDDWADGFFNSGVKAPPGTKFMYNSMNSYMLSAIIRERTGKDMFDILRERIFTPMGITEIYWERCPMGITKGGWGLYMKIEDLMKFAKLFLSGGIWNDKRLVSKEWIAEMTKKHMDTPAVSNKHGYGFHVWRSIRRDSYQFNGMLGQNLIILPDLNMAIATYCGSPEFFPNSTLTDCIERHFGEPFHPSPTPLKPSRRAVSALTSFCTALSLPSVQTRTTIRKNLGALTPILGKTYKINGKNLGLLPVVMSLFHNNFSDSIEKIAFQMNGETIEAVFIKGNETIRVPFSPDGSACYFDLTENGEVFSAAAIGKMTKNEDDIPVLKLSIFFLETSSVRHIKFFFHRTKTVVRFTEEPTGSDLLEKYAPMFDEFSSKSKAIKTLFSKNDFGIVDYNIERLFAPEFIAEEE